MIKITQDTIDRCRFIAKNSDNPVDRDTWNFNADFLENILPELITKETAKKAESILNDLAIHNLIL